jgi:hypothetical protein
LVIQYFEVRASPASLSGRDESLRSWDAEIPHFFSANGPLILPTFHLDITLTRAGTAAPPFAQSTTNQPQGASPRLTWVPAFHSIRLGRSLALPKTCISLRLIRRENSRAQLDAVFRNSPISQSSFGGRTRIAIKLGRIVKSELTVMAMNIFTN